MSLLGKVKQALGFGNKPQRIRSNSKYVSYNTPLFYSEDKPIYAHDIIANCDHRIASVFAKTIFKSVKEDSLTGQCISQEDSINGLFRGKVNQLCTFYEFKYKACRLLLQNEDVFIFPAFKERKIGNGKVVRDYTSLYLIDCANVTIYPTETEMRIEFKCDDGTLFDMPYSDVIHWRYRWSRNSYFGGDGSGKDTIKNLITMHVVVESIPRAIEAGLNVTGILTMKTIADADRKDLAVEEFEKHIISSKYGIVATDYESDFTPINIQPKDIPDGVIEFITKHILAYRGVSSAIYFGDYNDEQSIAFYETVIEGLTQSFKEAFDATLYTSAALNKGYQIKVYDRKAQSLSLATRISILEKVMPSALLSRAEQRELLGYEPDGEPDRVSLNWIETSIATSYQLESMNGGNQNVDESGKDKNTKNQS